MMDEHSKERPPNHGSKIDKLPSFVSYYTEEDVNELTSSLAEGTAAQENARAGFLRSSDEQRKQAEAVLQALRAEWERRHERDEELLREAQAQAETERQAWQQQLNDLQTQFERQRQTLAREAEEYREQAASLRQERDTALQQFDQERATLRQTLAKVEQESTALRRERTDLLSRLAAATEEGSRLALQCDELRSNSRHSEERLQEKLRGLTETLQETHQHVQKLRAELDQQHLREKQHRRDLATFEQERALARNQAAEAQKQLDAAQQDFEQERQALLKDLEEARYASAAAGSPYAPHPIEATRLSELALKVEALEAEVGRQRGHGLKRSPVSRGLAALGGAVRRLLGSSPKDVEESPEEDVEPVRRLRALWTEVMSERERVLRETAESVRAGLERQLAEVRLQLQAATERADHAWAIGGPPEPCLSDQSLKSR